MSDLAADSNLASLPKAVPLLPEAKNRKRRARVSPEPVSSRLIANRLEKAEFGKPGAAATKASVEAVLTGNKQQAGETIKVCEASSQKDQSQSQWAKRAQVEAPAQAAHLSTFLKDLLKNNNEEKISIATIVESMGGTSQFGSSLLIFSVPEVLPIPLPGMSAFVVIPSAIISCQMMMGNEQLKLPDYILRRSLSRSTLELGIKSILPVLEKMERYVKPRAKWATHPIAKRFLGLFIFILALGIALPIPGTNMPLAVAIFVIALGMIENDGLLILLGVLIGLAALALIGTLLVAALSLFSLV